ncbi:MAG: FAD-dependent oxidoreductase [Bacteroidales bacterium]
MDHVVILGNGIAGITAARHIRKLSDVRITVISSETEHFYSRTALMYIYMGHMKYEHTKPYEDWFWKKNRIELVNKHVQSIDTKNKTLIYEKGGSISFDTLILATGSKPNKFGWPGQDLKGVSGLYSFQDLKTIENETKGIKRGVIVGGGLIGVELAEMLHSRGIEVTFLVREPGFWNIVLPQQESELVSKHILKHGIDLRLNTELKEIVSDEKGRVKSVITNSGEEILCQFVGLTAGVHPNIESVKDSEIEVDRGILVNEYFETNIPGIYAIGDCAQHKNPPGQRKAIEQVWYTGRMQGETVAQTICGNRLAYKPGIWFNSAKFFDIEYQTYGWVWNELKENETDFYWENKSGDKCLKLVYNKTNKSLLGINVLGIRIRHEIAEKWINEKTKVEDVIDQLHIARFDPEFSEHYEKEISIKFSEAQV